MVTNLVVSPVAAALASVRRPCDCPHPIHREDRIDNAVCPDCRCDDGQVPVVEWFVSPDRLDDGTRVQIVAGENTPARLAWFGEWQVGETKADGFWLRRSTLEPSIRLHPGCVVASGVVAECRRLVDLWTGEGDEDGDQVVVYIYPDGQLLWVDRWEAPTPQRDLSDQWLDQQVEAGGWMVRLVDVAAVTERCPQCWGSGLRDGSTVKVPNGYEFVPCPTCDGAGRLAQPLAWEGSEA